MLSSSAVRRRGAVMLASGLFLLCLIGGVAWTLAPLLASPGVQNSEGAHFTGTAEQARTIVQLFWLLIAFGAFGAVTGAWQLATGRRNRAATAGVLALAGIVFLAVRVADLSLSTGAI
jgi:cbb3-type cytochrome oxidase subunit 3